MARPDDAAPSKDGMRPPRERGAALLLVFLAILVLVVLISQITVSSAVDQSIAFEALDVVQYDYAAQAGFEKAVALLLRDLKDEQSQAAAGEDPGMGPGGPLGGPMGDPLGQDETGDSSSKPTDSLLDEWADSTEVKETFGDVETSLRIVDEDRKLNLYTLVAADEEWREASRERFVRLIDTFREDTDHDLSTSDGEKIADGLEDWLHGERNEEDFPIPVLATDEAEDEEEDDPSLGAEDQEEVTFVFGLDELAGVEGVNESILRGFMDGDRYVPGLMDVVSVHSHLKFDEEALNALQGNVDPEGFIDPTEPEKQPEGETPEGETPEQASEGEESDESPEEAQGSVTNHGRININTVPLLTLAALMPPELVPYSVMEKIDEYRRLALEEDPTANLIFGDEKSRFEKTGDDEEEEEEEEDDYLFHSPGEVLSKVEETLNVNFDLSEDAREEFAANLVVKSNVFTIFVETRRQDQNQSHVVQSGDRTPPDRIYRAVVWRRVSPEGKVEAVTVVPLHPWTGVLPPADEDYREEHPWGF